MQTTNEFYFYNNVLIFLISFFSNTFSAISGGGAGLIQLPALLLLGLPYYQALATHKVATVALGLGGSIRNFKSIKNDIYVLWQILFFGTPGVILGSSIVNYLSEEILYLILGLFSIILAIYSFRKPSFGLYSVNNRIISHLKFKFIIPIFLIGILNGSVSSGTGLLVTILLIKTFQMDFLRAVSLTFFTVGIFWNAIGAFFLSRIGSIPTNLLVILILGSFSGGYFGAHLSNLKGNKLIKNTFTIVCLLVGVSLLLKSIANLK
ncbi:Predicted permease [Prochlorococcus marinus str. MIT 9515]|uniref:Probable membrane transporter protein n=1 Tax=Prochlorococcus marinus (strain MIT 9515) TaxID=167542 RepID=A2BWV2_PROM5|nr:sulfite exporter TauE/SafE family protein [Prochlorococcus marinus]ABM72263.1 Predicted permease [Prochlorococcus marinus str. MIT 9515]